MTQEAGKSDGPGSPNTSNELQKWIVVLAATFCVVAVGLNLWAWFGPPSWRPRIGCGRLELDLGDRHVTESVDSEFVISNTGHEELIITGVSTDCRCLTVKQTANTIPPGRSLILPVRIALQNERNGNLTRHLLIRSNDKATPYLLMTVRGRVFGQVEISGRGRQ